MFPCYLLVPTSYLVDTSSYLVVTSAYLVATTGYFWLPVVTSRYFLSLLVPRFSKNGSRWILLLYDFFIEISSYFVYLSFSETATGGVL